jgi:hypothetical protein
MSNPTPPLYLPAVVALGAGAPPGRVSHLFVLHDDGCPLLAGAGPCACKPTVTRGFRLWHRTRRGCPWAAVGAFPTERQAWDAIQKSGRRNGDWCVLPADREP